LRQNYSWMSYFIDNSFKRWEVNICFPFITLTKLFQNHWNNTQPSIFDFGSKQRNKQTFRRGVNVQLEKVSYSIWKSWKFHFDLCDPQKNFWPFSAFLFEDKIFRFIYICNNNYQKLVSVSHVRFKKRDDYFRVGSV